MFYEAAVVNGKAGTAQPIGTAKLAPYTINWNNVSAGTYRLTAVATDLNGGVTTSAPVTVTVAALNGIEGFIDDASSSYTYQELSGN